MINTPKSSLTLQLLMARLYAGHPVEMTMEMTLEDITDRIVVWDSLGAYTGPEIPKPSKRPRKGQEPKSRFLTANEYNTPKR